MGYWVATQIHFEKPELVWVITGVGGVTAMILVMLAFNAGLFIIGALAGGVVYHAVMTVAGDQFSLPWWGMLVAAGAGGLLGRLLRERILAALTAIVGGYLVVEAGARLVAGNFYDWGPAPAWARPAIRDAVWFILAFAGIMAQRSRPSRNRDS